MLCRFCSLLLLLLFLSLLQGNHIYTSGATGTNAAVIKGALRAENKELLTVILPQSLSRQPAESQELLSQVCSLLDLSVYACQGTDFGAAPAAVVVAAAASNSSPTSSSSSSSSAVCVSS
jgi:hypothetical protein